MRHSLGAWIAALCLLLGGCASTIQSEVTAFHEWPAELRDRSFVFERNRDTENNLEYRNYENLVRGELLRLGFADAADARSARLKVALRYSIDVRDIRVIQPVIVDSWGSPWYGPRWHRYGPLNPFYDPFWPGIPVVAYQDARYQLFTRLLNVTISQTVDARKLFDVTVKSEGSNGSLATVMPYMVRSAFAEFPGRSGVPRIVNLKMEK
jgi:hypothetical protein